MGPGRSARTGALVAGIGGLMLLFAMFLSWYQDVGVASDISIRTNEATEFLGLDGASARDATQTGWQAMGWFGIAVILAAGITALALFVVVFWGLSYSAPIALASAATGFGGLAFLVIFVRVLDPPGVAELEREIGIWLGWMASAAIAVGGYMGMQEDPHPAPAGSAAAEAQTP